MIIESCCETIEQAVEAEKNGATRIEFCRSLEKEGLTPKVKDVARLLSLVTVPVRVMIRPVDSFYISDSYLAMCIKQIRDFDLLPIEGFVVGYLTMGNKIDTNTCTLLLGESPKPFTFHKAIDQSKNIMESLQILEQFASIDTILSSGGFKTAMDGAEVLQKMQDTSSKIIMAGGRITNKNLHKHHKIMQLQAYHGTKIV